jgi:FkbM family methyltransferase
MRRFLKKHLNRYLPDSVRQSFKRRFAAKFGGAINANLVFEETASALRCTIDDVWSFYAPLACKDDLVHFTTTLPGRAEFYSIAQAAKSGGTLFDIGAHSGLISALFCAANSQNRAFSFEPSPILCERLSAIRALNQFGDRMKIEQIGIGETSGVTEMLLDPGSGYVQTQRFDQTMWSTPEVVQMRIESIPDAASRLNVIPQFIKLDIESYEYEAIKGSLEFLARHKPVLFLELHLNYLDQRNISASTVVQMVEECGYRFYAASGLQLKASELYDSPLPNVHVIAR